MITNKRIRAYVVELRSAERARITRSGEVHVRKDGRWLFEGFSENIADEIEQKDRDRKPRKKP